MHNPIIHEDDLSVKHESTPICKNEYVEWNLSENALALFDIPETPTQKSSNNRFELACVAAREKDGSFNCGQIILAMSQDEQTHRKAFYEALYPDLKGGHICIGQLRKKGGVHHLWAQSVEDILATSFDPTIQSSNLFCAPGIFKTDKSRKGGNAIGACAFWVDLDVGESEPGKKKYGSQEEAVIALRNFVWTIGLPKPWILNSGRGIHAYWMAGEFIEKGQWKGIATALHNAMVKAQLSFDATRTKDIASLMRLVFSKHRKDESNTLDTYILQKGDPFVLGEFVTILETFNGAFVQMEPESTPKLKDAGNKEFMDNHPRTPFKIEDVANRCNQMKMIRDTKGNVSEPLWYAGLQVMKFATDGKEKSHEWSKGHDGYDPDEVNGRLKRLETISGPTSCEKFKSVNPKGCEECRWAGAVSFPHLIGEPEVLSIVKPETEAKDTRPRLSADLLPEPYRGFVKTLAEDAQCDPEMIIPPLLSVVASSIQRKYAVVVGPRYSEPAILWTIAALPSGSRKSHILTEVTKPIGGHERTRRKRLTSPEALERKAKRSLLETEKKNLEKKFQSDSDSVKRNDILTRIAQIDIDMPPPEEDPVFRFQNFTPEKLEDLLSKNGGSGFVGADEGGTIDVICGLYNDGKANLDTILKTFSVEEIRVDRMTRTAYIEKPAISIALLPQPVIVEGMWRNKTNTGRGFVQRFLFIEPDSLLEDQYLSIRATNEAPYLEYSAALGDLFSIPDMGNAQNINLSSGAFDALNTVYREWSRRGGKAEDDVESGWFSKLRGTTPRIALALHAMKYGKETGLHNIEKETMETAIQIARVFVWHFDRLLSRTFSEVDKDNERFEQWLIRKKAEGVKEWSWRELSQGRPLGRTQTAKRLEEAIRWAERTGLVSTTDPQAGGRKVKLVA